MKHYAVFINGVRGGTIAFQNTEYGEQLKEKFLMLAPTVSIRPIIGDEDVYYREMKTKEEYKRDSATAGGIGAAMVRQMIGKYEGHPYD